jgi:oxalate decarboxylase
VNGPVPPESALPLQGALTQPPQTHRYQLLAEEPHSIHKYGRERRVGAGRFPISETITGVVLDIEPGGLRELHWHPNADEWQYVINGQFSVSLFGSHGRYRVETLGQGDVAYIPQGYGHSIENVGSKAGRILIGLNSGHYEAIDLSQWIAAQPGYVLANHFGKPEATFANFPKSRAFISPPDGQGRREIK